VPFPKNTTGSFHQDIQGRAKRNIVSATRSTAHLVTPLHLTSAHPQISSCQAPRRIPRQNHPGSLCQHTLYTRSGVLNSPKRSIIPRTTSYPSSPASTASLWAAPQMASTVVATISLDAEGQPGFRRISASMPCAKPTRARLVLLSNWRRVFQSPLVRRLPVVD
jgi:hypothetical protein